MKNIPLNSSSAKLLGRTIFRGEKLWLTHSASGCEFIFTGRTLRLTVGCDVDAYKNGQRCNKPRVAVLCDGRPVVKKVVDELSETYTIVDSAAPVTKSIRIVKLSEAAFSLACVSDALTDDEAHISPAPAGKLRIEFIGDSITCGYGIDDSNMQSDFATEAENAMKSYAYIAADLLKADYSMFSYSGYGLISGYTPDGERNSRELIMPWYETTGFSHCSLDGQKLQDIPWDFSAAPNNIVVVNLGTNDNSFCTFDSSRYDEFTEAYMRFLKTIRRCEPDALIICSIGTITHEPMPFIKKAVSRLNDNRILTFQFTQQNGLLGFGSNWHPSEDTQLAAGEELARFIDSLI